MAHPPELHVLDHLAYVLECLAENIRGDAKHELGQLVKALESDSRYAIADAGEKTERLRDALAQLRGNDLRGAAAALAQINRELWRRTLDE